MSVEWNIDHFNLVLVWFRYAQKTIFTFSFPVILIFDF